jgi:hypothetical protein
MRVQLWFDPACPFCWMTSRWLVRVAPERGLEVEWLPISLLVKNGLEPGGRFYDDCKASHGMLRVVESLREAGRADSIGAVYTELGRHLHVRRDQPDMAAILTGLDLDPAHAAAADDERFDVAIRTSMDDGLGLVGDDVGTPIIAVERADGQRVGLFGPVITDLPDLEASLRLWDGFAAMVATDGFFELKRTRTTQPTRLSESDL